MPYLAGYVTPQDYGAVGDGATDDTAAIQAALNATPVDGILFFPAAKYATTAPLTLPPGVTMYGQTQLRPRNSSGGYPNLASNVYIAPKASFSGAAVIIVNDALTGGYTTMAQNSRIIGIHLACEAIPSGSIDGIRAFGQVQGLILDNVSVTGPSGYCFNFAKDASIVSGPVAPWSVRMRGCYGGGGGAATTIGGVLTYAMTDATFIDCEMIGIGGDGWQIQGGGANVMIGCRGENCTGYGFHMTQTALAGVPTISLIGCHTDLNTLGGYFADQAGLVTFQDCISDGEGGTVAGFDIRNATGVVRVSNCVANPSSGTNSQYGINVQNAATIILEGGAFYGSTSGYHNGGTITSLYVAPNVMTLTGSTSSPTVGTVAIGMSGAGGIGMAASIPNQSAINIASTGSTPLAITGSATGQKMAAFTGADVTTIAVTSLVTGDGIDRYRQLVDGSTAIGPGNAGRDTFTGRAASGIWYASPTLLVGATSALGDNGSGEIQLHNAATVPTTNPTAGAVAYARNGGVWSRDPNGVVSPMISPSEFSASPTGCLAETFPRVFASVNTVAIGAVTGTVEMVALWLPAGLTITNVSWLTGATAASVPTHWWLGIADSGGVQRGHCADQTSGAIAANTLITKALTSAYTTTATGLYYVLISVTATTNPTSTGIGIPTNANALTPLLGGVSATTQSAPGTDGTTTYAIPATTNATGIAYAYFT